MLLDGVLGILIIACLYTDILERKIYNFVLVPALVLAVILNYYYGGYMAVWGSIKGFFLGLGFLIIPFAAGGIGAGDVKLLGVIGALKGTNFVFYCFLATAIAGGVIASIVLIKNRRFLGTIKNMLKSIFLLVISMGKINTISSFQSVSKEELFPYGLAIAIGTISTYLVV